MDDSVYIAGEDLRPGDPLTIGSDGRAYKYNSANLGSLPRGISTTAVNRDEHFRITVTGMMYFQRSWDGEKRYLKALIASLEKTWQRLYGGR